MKIFNGSTSEKLANSICNILCVEFDIDIKPGKLKIDKFLDGEILPLFEETVRDEDVFFIQSTMSSDTIMETLLIIDAAKRAGCKSFTLVSPFQGYSRQDKTDHLRSSIGSKLLADILEKAGMTRIITIDLHASAIQGFYNVPVVHLNGNKIFIEHIKNNQIDDLTIIAPDQGAVKRATDFCKAFPEATFAMINKKRIKPNEIHSMELVGDVEGRNVVIVDDMADTLGTLKKASELVMKMGAKSVRAIATHGVLSGKALDNLETSMLTELMVSDSISTVVDKKFNESLKNREGVMGGQKLNIISCDRILAKSINFISKKKSIHELNIV
jgi:ribose-phosphate pyrophosphokinase